MNMYQTLEPEMYSKEPGIPTEIPIEYVKIKTKTAKLMEDFVSSPSKKCGVAPLSDTEQTKPNVLPESNYPNMIRKRYIYTTPINYDYNEAAEFYFNS